MIRLALALVLAATAANAWEPGEPKDIDARLIELRKLFEGKERGEVQADKLARARQEKPAWLGKTAWKVEAGGKAYYFGVGSAPAKAAESRARGADAAQPASVTPPGALGRMAAGAEQSAGQDAPGAGQNATGAGQAAVKAPIEARPEAPRGADAAVPIDWYLDEAGTLWSLAVEVK